MPSEAASTAPVAPPGEVTSSNKFTTIKSVASLSMVPRFMLSCIHWLPACDFFDQHMPCADSNITILKTETFCAVAASVSLTFNIPDVSISPMSMSPEPSAIGNLDNLYRYRGEQEGCTYRSARLLFVLITAVVGLFFLGSCAALLVYINVARDLPSANDLTRLAATFNATRVVDRKNRLLFELDDPEAGR